MKTLLLLAGVLVFLFASVQIYFILDRYKIEKYPFKILKNYGEIEIRKYESTLFTSVTLNSNNYDKVSREGFRILGNYIFGGNRKKEKIAMTSPVTMSLEDSMRIMFMVPKDYDKNTLPKPNAPNIEFNQEEEKTVAVISFRGWANAKKISAYKDKLTKILDSKGIKYSQNFFFLGYNAPFEMIMRKNEVIVELIDFKV